MIQVIAGQGTVALEILQQVLDMSAIIACCFVCQCQ